MSFKVLFTLYGAALLYAALTYFLGSLVPLATIVLGFGLLIIPYLLMEWVATPVVAVVMGLQSRWSVGAALVFGVPLVALVTSITPVIGSGSETLGVPVPWLAVFAATKARVVPVILNRLAWWGALYLLALLIGLASRRIWRLGHNRGT